MRVRVDGASARIQRHGERSPGVASAVAGTALAGLVLNAAWLLTVLSPSPRPASLVQSLLGPAIGGAPESLGEAIGIRVGRYSDASTCVCDLGAAVVGLIAAALLTGRLGEVRRLEVAILAFVPITIGVSAALVLPTGFAMQGRYILPALVALPMLAGEVFHRNQTGRARLWARFVVPGAAMAVAVVQLIGWYSASHRYAVGRQVHGSSSVPPYGSRLWAGCRGP